MPSAWHVLAQVTLGETHPESTGPVHAWFTHVLPLLHAVHAPPEAPHALLLVPGRHVLPEQHPAHDVKSQTHVPPEQYAPLGHAPFEHVPPQPSESPHALPAQLGAHAHLPAIPPAPHFVPLGHGAHAPPP